jgi:uncharacterized protein GlcG (DUF336 family)/mannose-6-phosphate isomerase-like protein (cupin superfamily)
MRFLTEFTLLFLGLAGGAQASHTAVAPQRVAEKKVLTLDGAMKVMAAAVASTKSKAGTGVIAVVDDGGHLLALERLDHTFAAGSEISIGKARTSALFQKPTRVFEEIIAKGRTAMVALPEFFTPLQGGVPIVVDGDIVGAIGVSGAASAAQDEEIAIAGAAALATTDVAASLPEPQVRYWDGARVSAAFVKGDVLFDGTGANYQVHASHRDQAGMAEVHTAETDVIHVLEGGATLVTGGHVVDGRNIGPEEVRGTSIHGGETRRLAKGDVIVIPAGTPHWFQTVDGAIDYYVVKVRTCEGAAQ